MEWEMAAIRAGWLCYEVLVVVDWYLTLCLLVFSPRFALSALFISLP